MGRFIGFAILAIVVLFTLAILFRGESVLDDAVSQMQQAAQDLTPIVEPPEVEEEPTEPIPEKLLRPLPDLTPIYSAERRANLRTKNRYYIYIADSDSPRPHAKIQYLRLEALNVVPVEDSLYTLIPRATVHATVHYQVTSQYVTETEARNAALLPNVFQETLFFDFAWTDNQWVICRERFDHIWKSKGRRESFLARRPPHMKLVEHQFQEFPIVDVLDEPVPAPSDNPVSDNPYGSSVSQTTP
ncbi:hypothetical protein [Blastopirellula marina]|uniref:Uncharacterized protein n=1 Tax=Blastopirellula marina DSM 3645 TaxID=314230 RepID=A3ZRH1_9BACT|nr:hypothetical protein [Blastopirellula marina]EAQ80740.1 hypothetical protein DSM3645_12006 [Blastopirellula marina DSM 3645]